MKNELGGLFMVGLPGARLDDSTRELIDAYGISSFILFKRNVVDPVQLGNLCGDLVAACHGAGLPSPLISIDQEGGSVARLRAPFFTEFPDARELAESEDAEEKLADYARVCARELLALGVNMNLAPVLDVCPAGRNLVMERRSLGEDPVRVARLGALVIGEMQGHGLAACAKHFPGLGSVSLDPHEVRPVVDRSCAEMESCDLLPFQAAISAEVAAVMTSHTVYPHLDRASPATLSAAILGGLLRDRLGYSGLVITDDLEMGAIEKEGTVADAALLAFLAGADLLLICHDHDKIRAAHACLAQAMGARIPSTRVRESLRRIDAVRERFAGG
ncbi:beta-N-acetylhexosaminidase [Thiovibrio sp. JS02]